MRIVPRFSPPREITVYTIGGSGNNALGGANNIYTPGSSGDLDVNAWGSPTSVIIKMAASGLIKYGYYRFGDKKFRYGYFVYRKQFEENDFSLVYSNRNLFESWSTEVNKLPMSDLYYTVDRKCCETIRFQYGDVGVVANEKVFGS